MEKDIMGKMKTLRMDIEEVLGEYMFEINDVEIRHSIWTALREVVPSYLPIIVDETNNTPETIAKNELHVQIVGLAKIIMDKNGIRYGY